MESMRVGLIGERCSKVLVKTHKNAWKTVF